MAAVTAKRCKQTASSWGKPNELPMAPEELHGRARLAALAGETNSHDLSPSKPSKISPFVLGCSALARTFNRRRAVHFDPWSMRAKREDDRHSGQRHPGGQYPSFHRASRHVLKCWSG